MNHLKASAVPKRLKQIEVALFLPGNSVKRKMLFAAGKGKVFLPGAIEEVLAKVCAQVEKELPGEEYRLVKVGTASFNIVHQGKAKEAAA